MEAGLPGDASTLIYLAKADAFTDAAKCLPEIIVPPAVWREAVVQGERIGALEVPRIHEALRSGVLRQAELAAHQQALAATLASEHRLGRGESEVLALASSLGRAIVDEGRAGRVARALDIVPISTLFLPALGRARGSLDEEQAVELLRRLAVVAGAGVEATLAIEQHLRGET